MLRKNQSKRIITGRITLKDTLIKFTNIYLKNSENNIRLTHYSLTL